MKVHKCLCCMLLSALLVVGALGCGLDKYNWRFGLGTDADDGVTTDTQVDRLKDGVLPPEPETPEKPKKGEADGQKTAEPKEKTPTAP